MLMTLTCSGQGHWIVHKSASATCRVSLFPALSAPPVADAVVGPTWPVVAVRKVGIVVAPGRSISAHTIRILAARISTHRPRVACLPAVAGNCHEAGVLWRGQAYRFTFSGCLRYP